MDLMITMRLHLTPRQVTIQSLVILSQMGIHQHIRTTIRNLMIAVLIMEIIKLKLITPPNLRNIHLTPIREEIKQQIMGRRNSMQRIIFCISRTCCSKFRYFLRYLLLRKLAIRIRFTHRLRMDIYAFILLSIMKPLNRLIMMQRKLFV